MSALLEETRKCDLGPGPLSHFPAGATLEALLGDGRCFGCGGVLERRRRHARTCDAKCRQRRRRWRTLPYPELAARLYGLRPGDFWRTPAEVFADASARFGPFTLDAAAFPWDALCSAFIPPWEDSLQVSWAARARGAVWCNPPYGSGRGGLLAWVEKAVLEADLGVRSVLLVPPSMGSAYMRIALQRAELVHPYDGRISFLDPISGAPARSPRGDSALLVFGPGGGPARVEYLPRPAPTRE